MFVGNQLFAGRVVLSEEGIIVDSVARGAAVADHLPNWSIGAFDFRPCHPPELSLGRTGKTKKRGDHPDNNFRGSPIPHSDIDLVLDPKAWVTPTCRPLTSYLGNSSIPYLCIRASSIFDVRSVLSGKTI